MKKILILAGASLMLATACSDEQNFGEGQGRVLISTSVSTDMAVVSRSLEEDYAASTMIWISSNKGLIRRYNSLGELPTEPLVLQSGSYVAEGWCGDSVPASFDDRWFKAYVPFTVVDNQTTNVPLTLKIANVAVSVKYDEAVSEVLRNCRMTVGHNGGKLEFAGETADRRGYFMMSSTANALEYKLEAEQLGGTPFEYTGTIENPKPATEYILHVQYNPHDTEMGGAYFTITIDETPIPVLREDVEIIVAPTFKGYGFDISKPVNGEKGQIGRRTVYVSSATRVAAVEIVGDALTPIAGGRDVELFAMAPEVRQALADAGINYVDGYYNEADNNTLLQINFEPEFTDALNNGEYTFELKATDVDGRTSTATLAFSISDAPVATVQIAANDMGIYTNRATVAGTVIKPGAGEYGIRYRKAGAGAWTSVAATPDNGEFSVQLTGLEAGTAYDYAAYADDFTAASCSFTTEAAAQLPNAGFEDWDTSSSTYLVHAPGGEMFWDSGNHGATTMPGAGSITTPDGNVKHSGNYSAKLYSKFVGFGSIGKFAAGNLFAGKYLNTDGTDGILGWGRSFTSRPTAVKVWVKYNPGTVVKSGAVDGYLNIGDSDRGVVYMALTDGTLDSYTFKSNTYEWPVVVRTKKTARRLFSEDEERVIAYGRHEFNAATDGDGMVQITIPLDYKRTDVRPSNIIFVCSASVFGDYFCGGEGSTMWIDDIELVYE